MLAELAEFQVADYRGKIEDYHNFLVFDFRNFSGFGKAGSWKIFLFLLSQKNPVNANGVIAIFFDFDQFGGYGAIHIII